MYVRRQKKPIYKPGCWIKSIEVKPVAELVKKTMKFFGVDEIEATEYLIEERRKIKEKNELKKNLGYKQAA